MPGHNEQSEHSFRSPCFETTHWSVVLLAGSSPTDASHQALEKLCSTYWYPLYVHVRRAGWMEEDAKDLTQHFFARFLERGYIGLADPQRDEVDAELRHLLTVMSR